jgi:hypothetical protein
MGGNIRFGVPWFQKSVFFFFEEVYNNNIYTARIGLKIPFTSAVGY